jgi:two-component system CheB/CheR fusion protein
MTKTRTGRRVSRATADGATHSPVAGQSFPIVGVGASAGGLEAFSALLKRLPLDTGMGFVLVQHLDPEHDSALTQLLGRATSLPVHEVTNNLHVEPNHVYVIPPNTNLSIAAGVLTLHPRPKTRAPHRSIDFFFEALAQDQRERAIGVILSGTATDGTLGLEAIKAEGGITFAQDDTARYDSMPRSAIAAGCVDFVQSPEEIAAELARIAAHPAVADAASFTGPEADRASATVRQDDEAPSGGRGTPEIDVVRAHARIDRGPEEVLDAAADDALERILLLLRKHSGVNFSLYKPSTVRRRVVRRMVLTKHDTLEHYARSLQGNGRELDALYSDVLISVTSFFRNPEAFDVLQRKVWPALLRQRGDEPIRVWTLGCSTGQEAYSIAMSFVEAAEKASRMRKLQVFATDLNDALLDKARHGLYAKTVAQDLSPQRLRRFFVEEQGGYRISKALREMVVFARQNVMSDPPFSRMDIISCRNLLIYFESGVQKRVFPVFHYALKPGGFLCLGASEAISGFTDLFEPVDKKHRIYVKKSAATLAFRLPATFERHEAAAPRRPIHGPLQSNGGPGVPGDGPGTELSAQREADRIAVNQFAPPAVLINEDLQILQFRGPTAAYLEPPTGKASFDVLKMARNGLMLPLRSAINKAKKENQRARKENVRIEQDDRVRVVNLEVIPLKNLRERCFLVVFEDAEKTGGAGAALPRTLRPGERGSARGNRGSRPPDLRRVVELETELAETRDYLQSIREEHEAANEELQASNEEVQSANEELQSINEELETSKEELESANEELTTVNEEMASRNTELNRLNSDLVNVQTSARLAIVLLGRDLTIRRFSVQAEKQLNLLVSDVGRPIGSVRHNLDLPDLDRFITNVMDRVSPQEREVQDKHGRWFSLRVQPYLTVEHKVDGAVLVLVDIDDLKRSQLATASAREYAESIIATIREPLLVLDPALRVESANRAFYQTFDVSPADTVGKFIYDLGNRQWDIPRLRSLLEETLTENHAIEDFLVEWDFERLGRRVMLLNARRMQSPEGIPGRIVLAIEDITERRQSEERLRDSEQRFIRFMEHLPGLAWIKDADGRYVYVNEATERAFRTPRHELYGKSDQALFPPEAAARFAANDRLALDTGSSIQAIESIAHDDGTLHPSIVSRFSIPGSDDETTLVGGVAIDITKLKEAERALRESEERYRTLFASIDEGFCIIERVDGGAGAPSDFRYVEANPAFAAQAGADGVVGKTIREAFPGEPEAWFETYDAILRTGEPQRFERGLVTRGRVLELYAFRVKDGSGRRVAVIFKDVTARKQAEAAQAMLAAIVASSDDAIVSRDPDGIVTSWNGGAERLFGYTAGEAVGRPISFLIPTDRVAEETVAMEHMRRGEPVEQFETVRRRKDGTLFDASITESPIRDNNGSVVGASKIVRDITRRKQAEEAIRESDRRKTEFLAMLAHELRNPLAPILVSIGILRRFMSVEGPAGGRHQTRPDEPSATADSSSRHVSRALDVLDRQVGQMVRLIDDLLDAGRISRGKIELRKERVDLSSVVEHVLEAVGPTTQGLNQEVTVELPAVPVYVDADPTRLAQIVGNLLNNASKFTDRGGHIWLTVECANDATPDDTAGAAAPVRPHVVIRVRDTGIGISADQLERVFEIFTQLDTSLERPSTGLGIGLTLVKTLTELHGGTVEVTSPGRGQGSEFVVRLPMRTETAPSPTARPTTESAATTPLRILIVDDNRDSTDMLAMSLTFAGHETFTAHDGAAAVEAATRLDPDVILMDIGLPILSGYEAARRIREANGEKRRPLLVALTGWGQEEDRRRSQEAGFDAHLVKPLDEAALAQLLAEFGVGKRAVER